MGWKVALFLACVSIVVGLFIFNPSFGAIFGVICAGFLARKSIPSSGVNAQQVASRLADGKAGVEHINILEHATEAVERKTSVADKRSVDSIADGIKQQNTGLEDQTESLTRASSAIDDDLGLLKGIRDSDANK